MCGIAGLIHRGQTGDVGREMTAMLQSLKHRGPDSTGYALYGKPHGKELVMRFKVAEQDEMSKGFEIHRQVKERRSEIERRLAELGAKIIEEDMATEYAFRFRIAYEGDLRRLANYIEDVEGRGDPLHRARPRADQGPGRCRRGRRPILAQRLRRHPRHRPHPHGDRIRRRHPLGASLLGLSVCRRLGGAQRPAHQLLERPPGTGAARPPLRVELRLRADRRLSGGQDGARARRSKMR